MTLGCIIEMANCTIMYTNYLCSRGNDHTIRLITKHTFCGRHFRYLTLGTKRQIRLLSIYIVSIIPVDFMILWVKKEREHKALMHWNLSVFTRSLSSPLFLPQHPVCGHRGLHQSGITVHGSGVGEAAQRAFWKVRRARHSESLHTLLSHHGSLTPRWARVTAG